MKWSRSSRTLTHRFHSAIVVGRARVHTVVISLRPVRDFGARNVHFSFVLGLNLGCRGNLLGALVPTVNSNGVMSGAGGGGGGGGGSSCLGAAAAASCSSAASPYAAAGGGAGVAGRLPARVLEHIFSYLELSDLMRCGLVCWHWNNILADENSEVWRSLCSRSLTDEALRSDILCNLPTYKGKVGSPVHATGLQSRRQSLL